MKTIKGLISIIKTVIMIVCVCLIAIILVTSGEYFVTFNSNKVSSSISKVTKKYTDKAFQTKSHITTSVCDVALFV